MSQSAERSPEKEPRRFSYSDAGSICVLLRTQPRQRLNVRDIDHRIGRDERVSPCDNFVEPISTDKLVGRTTSTGRAFRSAGRNLSIGQVWRHAQPAYE